MSSRKQGRRNSQVVRFCYVATPDAKERLSRAIAILLKAGIRGKRDEH